jgi:hypothetical protein
VKEEKRVVPFSEAQQMGALALLGENMATVSGFIKFGDSVEFVWDTRSGNRADGSLSLL